MKNKVLILSLIFCSCCFLTSSHPDPRLPCELPNIEMIGIQDKRVERWNKEAMTLVYNRVGPELACKALEDVEVWVYLHDDDPVGCVRHMPYQTCHFRVTDKVNAVEVDKNIIHRQGVRSLFDVIEHEFIHVVLNRMGVPSREHHQIMRSYRINTENRRSIEFEEKIK